MWDFGRTVIGAPATGTEEVGGKAMDAGGVFQHISMHRCFLGLLYHSGVFVICPHRERVNDSCFLGV